MFSRIRCVINNWKCILCFLVPYITNISDTKTDLPISTASDHRFNFTNNTKSWYHRSKDKSIQFVHKFQTNHSSFHFHEKTNARACRRNLFDTIIFARGSLVNLPRREKLERRARSYNSCRAAHCSGSAAPARSTRFSRINWQIWKGTKQSSPPLPYNSHRARYSSHKAR